MGSKCDQNGGRREEGAGVYCALQSARRQVPRVTRWSPLTLTAALQGWGGLADQSFPRSGVIIPLMQPNIFQEGLATAPFC